MDDGGYADCAGVVASKKENDMQPVELAKYKKNQEHSAFFTMGICAVASVALLYGLAKQEMNRVSEPVAIAAKVQVNIMAIRSAAMGATTLAAPKR